MITHKQKFKVGDQVKTNDLYRSVFSGKEPIKGIVTKIEPCNITETDKLGYAWSPAKISETVILVAVGNHQTINQDYFEKVD